MPLMEGSKSKEIWKEKTTLAHTPSAKLFAGSLGAGQLCQPHRARYVLQCQEGQAQYSISVLWHRIQTHSSAPPCSSRWLHCQHGGPSH